MNMKNLLLGAALILFLLNTLPLYFYFGSVLENRFPPMGPAYWSTERRPSRYRLKPWLILPSYLPWNQNSNVSFGSCEAYFGNGFTQRVDIIPRPSAGSAGGWFRCFYSETLRSSVCEGGRMRMVTDRIRVSRGGERLEDVIGRKEADELPQFEGGAFEVDAGAGRFEFHSGGKLVRRDLLDRYVPQEDVERHTMRELIESIHVIGAGDFHCDQWIEEPTLLVTRYEYANMFHTVTDWYSAYVSSRVTGLPYRPHLIFVDGHCKTPLEGMWRSLFSGIQYAKSFSGSVCFRHAIISPLGYETPLFRGLSKKINCSGASAQDLWQNPDERKTARLSEFGEFIRSSFGFSVNKHRAEKPFQGHNVLFVRREDYLAHPRHKGKVQSRLRNEHEVFDSVQKWASNIADCKINVVNGLFAHMPMKDQVQAIQEASIIVGAHGAGLTHIVSALPNTVILEIIAKEFRRPHFKLIAQWKGLEYHAIDLPGSYAVPSIVVDKLSSIIMDLGC